MVALLDESGSEQSGERLVYFQDQDVVRHSGAKGLCSVGPAPAEGGCIKDVKPSAVEKILAVQTETGELGCQRSGLQTEYDGGAVCSIHFATSLF
jgi:hypothetical protein